MNTDSANQQSRFAILIHEDGTNRARGGMAEIAESQQPRVIQIQDNIMSALTQARNMGCTHAIVLECQDDQNPGDLPALMNASADHPSALVIGYRGGSQSPHRLLQLLFRLETGLRLKNIAGPRAYPLALIEVINPSGKQKFGPMEILVRAAWAGCPIIETPLEATLPGISPCLKTVTPVSEVLRRTGSDGEKPGSSEYLRDRRPFPLSSSEHGPRSLSTRQLLREAATHVRLIARALSGWPHPKYDAGIVHPAPQPFWPRFWQWLNPFAAWRELRQGGSRNEMALGLAVGAFIGNLPAWGFHMAISLYVARRLHLNPLAVITGSHVSAPPMGPILVASAMWIGHVIIHGSRPTMESMGLLHGQFLAHALPILLDWTLGAMLVGTAVALVTYIVANFLFRFVERRPLAPIDGG